MSYTKQNFVKGQVLTAAQLNHIEEGIEKILPVIEAGETQLVTDKDGNLVWEDKHFKKEESLELLFPEFQMTGATTEGILTSLLAEVKDMDDLLIEFNGTEYSSFIRWVDNESALFNISFNVNGQDCAYSFLKNNALFIINRGNLTGTVKVKVNKVIYTKVDSNYLPTPCIDGTGKYSILLNHGGAASGISSCAANNSIAIGELSFAACGGTANGTQSFVCGYGSHDAEGSTRSIILGDSNKSTSGGSYILGSLNNSNGESSTIIGYNNTTNAGASYIVGSGNKTEAQNTYTLGYNNVTNATSSFAIGYATTTNAYGARTFGHDVHASSAYQTVLGRSNIIDANGKYLYILGNGTTNEDGEVIRSNAHTIDYSGNAWYAGKVRSSGIVITSPNGSEFMVTIDDNGLLSATPVVED